MEFSFRCSCCASGMSTRWLALACFRRLSSPLARIDSTWARTSKGIHAWRFKSEYVLSCYFGPFHRGGERTRGCHGATLRGAQWRQNATKRPRRGTRACQRVPGWPECDRGFGILSFKLCSTYMPVSLTVTLNPKP